MISERAVFYQQDGSKTVGKTAFVPTFTIRKIPYKKYSLSKEQRERVLEYLNLYEDGVIPAFNQSVHIGKGKSIAKGTTSPN